MRAGLMRGRAVLHVVVLALAALRCGGPTFTGDEDRGGTGAAAGGPSRPNAGSGGEGEPQPGGGGSDGGPSGSDGGAGGDTFPSAGSGGAGGMPRPRLDLSECGADAFGTGIAPTLYSTLDSAEAIIEPAIGELGFVGNQEGDYHGGRCAAAVNIDQQGDYIKYHYQDNEERHFDVMLGTLDFWYQPAYDHTDGQAHHLFGTANFDTVGGIRLSKAGAAEDNALVATFRGAQLGELSITVPSSEYSLSRGEWTRLTLVWYLGPQLPQRYTRLFIDGVLAGEAMPSGVFQMAPDLDGYFTLGVWSLNDPAHGAGLFDELKVFPRGP